jgi:predicted ester cyclase
VIDGDRVARSFTAQATHVGEFMGLAGTGRRFAIQGVLVIPKENSCAAATGV